MRYKRTGSRSKPDLWSLMSLATLLTITTRMTETDTGLNYLESKSQNRNYLLFPRS